MCLKTSGASVLTCSFWSTTGTGTTMAKSCGGPLKLLDMVMTVRLPLRKSATCEALLYRSESAPDTKKPQKADAAAGHRAREEPLLLNPRLPRRRGSRERERHGPFVGPVLELPRQRRRIHRGGGIRVRGDRTGAEPGPIIAQRADQPLLPGVRRPSAQPHV